MSLSTAFIIAVILLIEGFFAGSELALFSADRLKLKRLAKQGNVGAKVALKILQSPERVLSTTLLMTSLSIASISVLLTLEMKSRYGQEGELYAVILGTALVIVFGELIPKILFRSFAEQLAPRIARPILNFQKLISPALSLLTAYSSQLTRAMKPIDKIWGGKKLSPKDELYGLLGTTDSDVDLDRTERRFIQGILKFREKRAKDALIPLVKIDAIDVQSHLQEALQIFFEKKHTRLPVFEDRVDNLIGILELSDIVHHQEMGIPIRSLMKDATYVPETQGLESILKLMIDQEASMFLVVDEYGGAVGLLTREDVFETIVGDIEDEDDEDKKLVKALDKNRWIVKASISVSKLNESLSLDVPEGDYDTLAGFLIRQFTCIPVVGDELFFDTASCSLHISVRDSSARRIESVLIERLPRRA